MFFFVVVFSNQTSDSMEDMLDEYNMKVEREEEGDNAGEAQETVVRQAEYVIIQVEGELDISTTNGDPAAKSSTPNISSTSPGQTTGVDNTEDSPAEPKICQAPKRARMMGTKKSTTPALQSQDTEFFKGLQEAMYSIPKPSSPATKSESKYEEYPDYHFCIDILMQMNEMKPDQKKNFKKSVNSLLY